MKFAYWVAGLILMSSSALAADGTAPAPPMPDANFLASVADIASQPTVKQQQQRTYDIIWSRAQPSDKKWIGGRHGVKFQPIAVEVYQVWAIDVSKTDDATVAARIAQLNSHIQDAKANWTGTVESQIVGSLHWDMEKVVAYKKWQLQQKQVAAAQAKTRTVASVKGAWEKMKSGLNALWPHQCNSK